MKAGDKERLGVIRLVKRGDQAEGSRRAHRARRGPVLAVLDKMVKQRRDSVSQYDAAGREDLAGIERAESR
jgi:uncharacterized protein YqeY